ncbi:unnamed protein product [Clonostachys byssicola]|uniref:Rhodopsin domain-containing protein n=1 Tax=Clonostachys byssicola TaxID=160290 RepID=A0A9N9U1C8_9HYPO|nr:unnamed protein product [Clonostachys byssicola]
MRDAPKEILESWPAPDHQNPERQGPGLLIIQLIFCPLGIISVLARLYVRTVMVRRAGLDDWLMFTAMVAGVGVTVTVILATELYGWNIHVWDLTPSQATLGRKASISAQTLFVIGSGLVKSSILISYLRIAPLDSWFRRLTQCSIPLVVTLIMVFLIALWTQCRPPSAYWDMHSGGKCIKEGPPLIAQSIIAVLADILVYVLPFPTLYHLRLPFSQRFVLLIIFSCGIIVIIAGCMRTYWVIQVVDETYDVTWDGFRMWTWTAIEVNLGVICGCVPTLRPLFKRSNGVAGERTRKASAASGMSIGVLPHERGPRTRRKKLSWLESLGQDECQSCGGSNSVLCQQHDVELDEGRAGKATGV